LGGNDHLLPDLPLIRNSLYTHWLDRVAHPPLTRSNPVSATIRNSHHKLPKSWSNPGSLTKVPFFSLQLAFFQPYRQKWQNDARPLLHSSRKRNPRHAE
jgi:hypothetical protein